MKKEFKDKASILTNIMSGNCNNTFPSVPTLKADESKQQEIQTRAFWFLFPLKLSTEYTFSYFYVPRTSSTNDLAFTLPLPGENEIQIVSAEEQTAGRGQGNSSWEAESGKNLTFSLVCRAWFVEPAKQFCVLQAAALAVRHVLAKICDNVTIKWPNDIYIGDGKASGTLIQCDMENGRTRRMVIGIGVNVNQERFTSSAPNPVSLHNAVGHELDRLGILHSIAERFAVEYDALRFGADGISQRYVSHLYRKEGMHEYKDSQGIFHATFERVEKDGHLFLRDEGGQERVYGFKEVEFVL